MVGILKPVVKGTLLPDTELVFDESQKVLIVGQMTAAGTATPGVLYTFIGNNNEQNVLFGSHSQLAMAIRQAKKYNKKNRIDAIPIEDSGTGVGASGIIVFDGTSASANSTIYVGAGDYFDNRYKIDVIAEDTPTMIGDKVAAAVTANTISPVSGTNTTGSVGFVSINAGTIGNAIPLWVEGSIPGITIAITGMTGGSTDPVVTDIFDVVANLRYQTIVWQYEYGLTELTDFLDPRWNPPNKLFDGVGIATFADTLSNILDALNAENDQNIGLITYPNVSKTAYKGIWIPTMPYVVSAQLAAIRALRLTEGADISEYVIGGDGILDNTGGMALGSLPYMNTPFKFLHVGDINEFWTEEERDEIKEAGGSIIGNNDANDKIIADEIVTTYKKNAGGEPDLTFKYLNYVDTASICREYMTTNSRERYKQSRLTVGNLIPNRNMANASSISAFLDQLYVNLAGQALVPDSEDARKFFKNNKTVTINEETGTASVIMRLPINTQVRRIEETFKITFSIQGA